MSKKVSLKDIWDKLKPGDIFVNTQYTRTKIDDKSYYLDMMIYDSEIGDYEGAMNLEIEDYLISEEFITTKGCSCGYYYEMFGLKNPCQKQ